AVHRQKRRRSFKRREAHVDRLGTMFLFSSWVEAILVTLLAVAGVFLARSFSRQRAPFWMFGYFIPLAMLAVLIVVGYSTHHRRRLEFIFPFSWLMGGRVVFAVLAFIATM